MASSCGPPPSSALDREPPRDRGTPLNLDSIPGLSWRRPTLDDVGSILELTNAADRADYGAVDTDADDVRDDLQRVELATDAWLVTSATDGAVAFADLARRGAGVILETHVIVHPSWRRRGIGTALATAVEARALARVPEAPPGVRVVLRGWIKGDSAPERTWAASLGFAVRRQFLRMRIDMDAAPPHPAWPEGIRPRPFVAGQDERATFDSVEEAFADHWGHVPSTFEEWLRRRQRSGFDPDLWLLAVDGDEVVATSLGTAGVHGGWINAVGTRRAWRGRGIAHALLLEHFRLFWDRGIRTVQLGVDGESLTGAVGLYEKVGMRVTERYDQVGKVIREGRDPAVSSLEG